MDTLWVWQIKMAEASIAVNMNDEEKETAFDIYDLIKDIKDPERIESLEDLEVVKEDDVQVKLVKDGVLWITIIFTPTTPHCSLATLIGLCLRVKLERNLQRLFKLCIRVSEGTHSIEEDVNKQINDKERVAAAMENPELRKVVEECVADRDY